MSDRGCHLFPPSRDLGRCSPGPESSEGGQMNREGSFATRIHWRTSGYAVAACEFGLISTGSETRLSLID